MSFTDRQIMEHMVEAVEVASLLVEEGHARFLTEAKSQFAADTVLVRIGEGAKTLSDGSLTLMPEIPWNLVKGIRDRVAHASIHNDYEIIWSSLKRDIPEIGRALQRTLMNEGNCF